MMLFADCMWGEWRDSYSPERFGVSILDGDSR